MTTKEKVLDLLMTSDSILSGEKMAQDLAVSRTSVWKAIKTLEKEGFEITHEANGYRLEAAPEHLSATGIRQLFTADNQIERVAVLKTSESTMKDAKKAAIEDHVEATLFVAETQTAAKGRFGRPFVAKPKEGIYLSLLLNPYKKFSELPQYTVVMAVAVVKAVEKLTGKQAQIKWVNDIYLDGRKICGILSEAMSDVNTMEIAHIIIGLGFNLAIPQTDFPDELQAKATSLFPDGKPTITRNQLIAEIMNQFFFYLNQPQITIDLYREHSFVLGKTVSYNRQNQTYVGTAVDINDLGELIVDLTDGSQQVLASGEISLATIG